MLEAMVAATLAGSAMLPNLKTHKSMNQMHEDMQGSAVAAGTLLSLSEGDHILPRASSAASYPPPFHGSTSISLRATAAAAWRTFPRTLRGLERRMRCSCCKGMSF